VGQTPLWALPYPELSEPADVPADIRELAQALDPLLASKPPLVSSLPASPTDGQEVYYLADSVDGTVWHLRYRAASASAYKWEMIGGGPLSKYVASSQVVASTSFLDLTAGPTMTIPLAGRYMVQLAASGSNTAATGQGQYTVRYGGVDDGNLNTTLTSAAANQAVNGVGLPILCTFTAAQVLTSRGRTFTAGTATLIGRRITAMPVSVG